MNADDNIDSLNISLCIENLEINDIDRIRAAYPTAHIGVRPATQMPYASIPVELQEIASAAQWLHNSAPTHGRRIYICVFAESHLSWGNFLLPTELTKIAVQGSLPIQVAFATTGGT